MASTTWPKVNPALVYVATSPFGQDGPYAGHLSTDLTLAAMGGEAALNGDADRAPVRISTPQSWHHAAAESGAAALIAHHRRLQTGEAQFVDVSVQAAVTWTAIQAMTAAVGRAWNARDAPPARGVGAAAGVPGIDGECVIAPIGSTVPGFVTWMIEDGTVPETWRDDDPWPQYDLIMLTGGQLNHSMEELLEKIAAFTAKYPKAELMERGLQCGVTIAPVSTVADVLRFEHLNARGYWREDDLPGHGKVKLPGPFAWPQKTPLLKSGAAPLQPAAPGSIAARSVAGGAPGAAKGRLPFEGLKIADFAWIGAGRFPRYFADHGATVIRVETVNPPDRLRNVGPFKDGVAGVNQSQFFAMANSSKKGIILDLKSEAGKDVARKLLAWCDVAESFTPGTMAEAREPGMTWRDTNPRHHHGQHLPDGTDEISGA
ncbi:MAG: CoA transferase [Dehalococcoidia bacterium]